MLIPDSSAEAARSLCSDPAPLVVRCCHPQRSNAPAVPRAPLDPQAANGDIAIHVVTFACDRHFTHLQAFPSKAISPVAHSAGDPDMEPMMLRLGSGWFRPSRKPTSPPQDVRTIASAIAQHWRVVIAISLSIRQVYDFARGKIWGGDPHALVRGCLPRTTGLSLRPRFAAFSAGRRKCLVETERIELSSTGCKPVVLPLNDVPENW